MNKGALYAAAAYAMWGFFPLYFRAFHNVPATQVLTHRIAWSFFLVAAVIFIRKEFTALRRSLSLRVLSIYLLAAVLIAGNWFVYVWAVGQGHVVESSLGYFINPLVSVFLGVVFLRERLRLFQWIPIALAAVGVIYLTINFGALPWIALALAFTFGLYGLVKKLAPLSSLHGLTLETTILAPIAIAYLLYAESSGTGAFGHSGVWITLLLAFTGVVTVIPLLFFASGARRVPLTTLGLLQYTAPTLQFLIGVLVFKEPLPTARLVGFIIIWVALAFFSIEGFSTRRKTQPLPETVAEIE